MNKGDLKEKLIKIGGIAFLVYIFFLVGKTIYQNIKFNGIEKNLQREVDVLEAENTNLQNKILYYKTESYKERVMRERLGYQKPGEQVLVITAGPEGEEQKKDVHKEKISNPQKWWNFLFPQKKEE
ncbi:MAG: septum formation initiator family protein [bacterium]|nr:septum formation initiator family protein [bacterium]